MRQYSSDAGKEWVKEKNNRLWYSNSQARQEKKSWAMLQLNKCGEKEKNSSSEKTVYSKSRGFNNLYLLVQL